LRAESKYPEVVYSHQTVEKGHGRIETRQISVIDTRTTKFTIPGIQQVARIVRKRLVVKTGKENTETIYIITNLQHKVIDAANLLAGQRGYWLIENVLHYQKDMVFGEDRSTIRAGHGPANMASLRSFAIGLFLSSGITNIKRCVENIRHDPDFLMKMVA
jgi:predicted transposase YbfD/YdcC